MATEKGHYHPITCIVCEQTLPVLRYEGQDDPGYFPASSSGYKAGDEGDRACEDIGQLLRYAKTVNGAIWDNLANRDRTKKVNALKVEDLSMMDEDHYTTAARDLCFLFSKLLEEAQRRSKLRSRFVTELWAKDQAEGSGGGV